MTKKDAALIKKLLLIPIGLALGLLILAFFASVFWIQQANTKEHSHDHLALAKQLFEGMLDEESRLINGIIDFYAQNENLQKAFLSQDRDKLLAAAFPLFQGIRSKYQITHFYFINPDRVCFLRVHNPPRHGDYIGRHTMNQAAHSGLTSHGIELGPFGTFTLRIVRPWRIGDKLIGYIELGREIEHITPSLKKLLGLDFLFFINKSFLKRDKWEEGLTMMGRDGDWDQFPDNVLIDSTMPKMPADTGTLINLHQKNHEQSLIKSRVDSRRYIGGFIPLLDAGGNEVGDILALHDVTEETAQLTVLLSIMGITLLTGGILFFLFNGHTGRLQDRLMTVFDDLEEEIDERVQLAESLKEQQNHLEELVNERTCELSEANQRLLQENIERKTAEEQLTASLHEKEILLKEIHHRVKNNMQVVSSLLKLQARKIEDKDSAQILQESQNRIRAMSLIHEKIYRSENLAKIKFYGYIMDLATGLFSLYRASTSHISLHVDTSDDSMLDIDTAIPCGLIINELVTNSLKYAFPQGKSGEIRVLFKETGKDELTLTVSDNGVGIPDDIDFKNTESLGLHLVTMLAEDQLEGEISLDNTSGTEFKIRFRRNA